MRRAPTELNLSLVSAKTCRSAYVVDRARSAAHEKAGLPTSDALDAVFEAYTRVDPISHANGDQSSRASDVSSARSTTKALIADIAAQLDILDRQRQQLAALLSEAEL